MRIGSFAKLCKTQISVLRHYDKIGLIKPDFIDKFTDYRYYDPEQIKDFELISKFKKLGFSLKDIKKIMTLWDKHSQETEKIFDDKIKELEILISQIKLEKSNLLKLNKENIKMNSNKELNVNIDDIIFEDDPEVIGKWEILGEYDTKESFLTKSEPEEKNYGKDFKEIYFLPGGQRYWVYGWTKVIVINYNGDYTAANPYTIEEIDGEKYMFANWKSYDYIKYGGKETVLVLKQADNKKYTRVEIAKQDDIDKPFADDKKILGKWKAVAFVRNKDEYFNPDYPKFNLFFKFTEFKENGWCARIYGEENRTITSPAVTWTKNYVLKRFDFDTAEKYEIKTIDGKEYLFIEWKSGDYIWGGRDPAYYVFVRE
jgi:DNA-binding transcriptional MerR regulator